MKKTIQIEGMSCMHCVNAVKKELGELPGVTEVEVSLENKQAVVTFSAEPASEDRIREAIDEAGFTVLAIA